jgi:hypothetical protein
VVRGPNDEEDQQPGMVVGTGVAVGNHGIRNQVLAIQLSVNLVRREAIDIMLLDNITMTQQFRIMTQKENG